MAMQLDMFGNPIDDGGLMGMMQPPQAAAPIEAAAMAMQPVADPPKMKPGRSVTTMREITKKGSNFSPQYAGQFDDQYRGSIDMRKEQLDTLKQKLSKLEEAKPSGLAALDLKPFAQFADQIAGTQTAQNYGHPTGVKDYKEQVARLQDQVEKSSNSLTDDQMGYLKLKAQEEMMKVRETQAERQANKQGASQASQLRSQWLTNPLTKASQEVATAYEKVSSAAKDPSPAGDLSLIFGYMKMLDPGSVVREGEFASAQNAAAVPDRVRNVYNKIMTGERLNPNQRADFIGQAQKVYSSQLEQQNRFDSSFHDIAARSGLNPADIVLPVFKSPGGGKITVSNGKESLQIAPEDLQHALQDGYKQVK